MGGGGWGGGVGGGVPEAVRCGCELKALILMSSILGVDQGGPALRRPDQPPKVFSEGHIIMRSNRPKAYKVSCNVLNEIVKLT